MLELAGGQNVFGDIEMAYPQVSAEAIIARRPEVIIELMPETEITPKEEVELRAQWKQLGTIPATEHGRIYLISDDHCLIPSPRYVEIIDKVSRLLHPEPDVDR
jgi:ABC-type Fe3+-hydroxamate transport system substrate-binding protein